MRIRFQLIIVMLILLGVTSCEKVENLKAISYNIRYDNPNDGENKWDNRKAELAKFLKSENADVIGLQESLKHQLEFVINGLPKYEYVGVGRDDGKEKGEYAPILYNSEEIELIDSGHFWLSETPGMVSTGWDAALPRICTYGRFNTIKTNKEFYVFNAHFDHRGQIARTKSAELIMGKIKTLNTHNLPVILMGDFNAKPDEDPIKVMDAHMDDGLQVTKKPFSDHLGTFNGFNDELYDRIDYIFSKNFSVLEYRHAPNKRSNGLQLSDHIPIIGVFK